MTPDNLKSVREHIASHVIGQHKLIDGMLICLLSDGHLLVEGMPGLAKTTAVNALSEAVEGDFHRIQFTPDLLPSDLVGTDIYRHEKAEFEFRPGPAVPQHSARRRGQPRAGQGAGGAAGGHGRTPDHRGSEDLSAAAAVHGAGDPESRSSRKARITCRKRSWTVS